MLNTIKYLKRSYIFSIFSSIENNTSVSHLSITSEAIKELKTEDDVSALIKKYSEN